MGDQVKIAAILAAAAIAGVAAWIYFSPYHVCLRGQVADGNRNAEVTCAIAAAGGPNR